MNPPSPFILFISSCYILFLSSHLIFFYFPSFLFFLIPSYLIFLFSSSSSSSSRISAPEFVFVVNNWAKKQLSDLSLFHANGEWAEGTMHIIGKIVKQSFRIFAHVWHNHRLELAKDVKTFINSRPLYKDALKARQRGTMTDLLKK